MSYIKVYDSDISDQFTKVQLHYQLYFFNYLPYVLIDDLRAIDENAIGLFGLDKENERVAQSKYGERLYLYAIDGIPVEHGRFILNYSKGNFFYLFCFKI
ncbi:unnamed protein product [Rotaria sp. Silwood1]|nr:unnamed protein product [Rotaria sp. Silwood1]CAF1658309.1 unnamed protein product [Rotaria sp. Silwood1]